MNFQQKLRGLQDHVANSGWRIKLISHAPEGKPMVTGFKNWADYLCVIAFCGFPVGVGLAIYHKKNGMSPFPGVIIAVVSWVVGLISLGIRNLLIKRNWILVQAKCIDTEIKRVMAGKGPNWEVRILCEFLHDGSTTQCTPTVHWSSFRTEEAAKNFLKSRIAADGHCALKVNPDNLLEANLTAGQR